MTAAIRDSDRVFFFYGGLCRKVLVERALFSWFLVAAALHGIGHGLMAVAAAILGTAFTSNSQPNISFFGFAADPVTLALVGLAAALVKGAGATVGTTLQSRLAQNIAGEVRRNVAARLLAGGATLPTGQLAARLSVGLREVERGVEDGLLGGIRACFALVPLGVAIALVSTPLAWTALLLLAPFGVVLSAVRRLWRHSHARAMAVAEALHFEVDELVSHIDVWRTFGATEPVREALDGLAEQAARASSRAEGARAALSSANEVLAALTLLACIAVARWLSLPVADGSLIAFAVPFFMAYRPLRDLGDARAALERGQAALGLLENSVGTTSVRVEPTTGSGSRPDASSVRSTLRRWAPAVLEVRDFGVVRAETTRAPSGRSLRTSFTVRPGEMVAIVGPTGSGKTTLLRAMLGLEPGAVGSIRYGDDDLSRAGVGPSERPFAWAPQEAPLLAGSLVKNILFSPTDPGRVEQILGPLGAGDMTRACAGAILGAAGRPVSGGERKWIALARAIASDLPVLLLDEPTAGLDVASQQSVVAELQRLRRTRAIVLVTHQSDVAARADRVVAIGSDFADQNWASSRGSFSKSKRTSGMS